MPPKISIILPVKDGESTLRVALESCLTQELEDFELLLIDDHSSDDSVALARSLADPRINIVPNRGQGLVSALNTGLDLAHAELVARMDADDRMHPARLRKQVLFLEQHPDIDVLGCRVSIFPAKALQGGFAHFIDWQNSLLSHDEIVNQVFVETPLTHPSVMFRKSAIQSVGNYRQGDFPEDYELWLRLAQSGYRFGKLPETLFYWRESPQRLSRTAPNCRRSAFDALRASYLIHAMDRSRPLVICGAGRRTRQRCQHLLELEVNPKAWIDIDPNKIGTLIKQTPVIAIDDLQQFDHRPFVLNYVSQRGARQAVERHLEQLHFLPRRDYYSVG